MLKERPDKKNRVFLLVFPMGCSIIKLDIYRATDTISGRKPLKIKKKSINFALVKLNPYSMNVQFTNVNLDFYLKNPSIIGEHCYQLRKALSSDELVPKSFFANMLGCSVKQLAQIESGFVYDSPLAIRYLLKLNSVYKLFNP